MAETQRDQQPSIQDFLQFLRNEATWCCGTGGSKNETQPRYIPYSTLESYLKQERVVEHLLNALYPNGDPPDADTIRDHYLRPFAILICLNHGNFINLFTDFEHLQDNKLPLRSEPHNFPLSTTPGFWEAFKSRQWEFCPVTLRYNMGSKLDQNEILPLQFEEQIGYGGTSSVFKVTAHPEYNKLMSSSTGHGTSNAQPVCSFVVKTYRGREAEEYYTIERKAYMKLKTDGQPAPNIVGFRGSFVRNDTYNLILEYADKGTLEDFMKINQPPSDGQEIFTLWKQLFGLFRGLGMIHYVEKDLEGPRIMLGWHQDIKPQNILVKSRNDASIYGCHFLIADLGLTHFKKVVHPEQDTSDKDAGGTYAYGAPETLQRNEIETIYVRVGQQVDLWSLGCVFSEVAIWIDGGWRKVEEYRRLRQEEATKTLGKDHGEVFHNGQHVLNIVERSHMNIASKVRKDDFVTSRVLRGPVSVMLKEKSQDRTEAPRLYGQTDEILREGENELRSFLGKSGSNAGSLNASAQPDLIEPSILASNDQQPERTVYEPTNQASIHQPLRAIGVPPYVDRLNLSATEAEERPPELSLEHALVFKRQKSWLAKAHFPNSNYLLSLKKLDHVFLIDNSMTMDQHKPKMKEVLEVLGYMAKGCDPDGVDLFFTMSDHSVRQCKKSTKLLEKFEAVEFGGKSDMGARLDYLVREYKARLYGQRNERQNQFERFLTPNNRGLSIYVLTDGLWQPGSDVPAAIKHMVDKMQEYNLQKHHMGIQFIRFGEDPGAIARLEHLDTGLGLDIDIVNTTPANGSILKMLLGATNAWFGNDKINKPQ